MKHIHKFLAASVAVLTLAGAAHAELYNGQCEFWEGGDYSQHSCEIVYDAGEDLTILNAAERIVGFHGHMLRDSVVTHEGYRFDAFYGREFGYCFREQASGVAVCVTPAR